MEGVSFLLAIIGIGIVILWTRQNDKVPLEGETSGLLAMAETKQPADKAKRHHGRAPGGGPG